MPKGRKRARSSRKGRGTIAQLRRQAHAVMRRLQHAGRRQLTVIEREIARLDRQRQALLAEIGATLDAVGARRGRGGRGARGRRGRRPRIDWASVFAKLPRGPFKASDVRKFLHGVAPGTLSQRLTGWVKEKKLRRTGSRRGTRYTKG